MQHVLTCFPMAYDMYCDIPTTWNVTASNVPLHRRGCGCTNVELPVVASANV